MATKVGPRLYSSMPEKAAVCSRCGKNFYYKGFVPTGQPVYCRDCTILMKGLSMAEARLLKQEFDLELSDKKIAEQINALLVKESSEISRENEQLLGSLIEKWMDDEKKQ